MAALTNLLGNGITRLLGIRNLTWEDLEKYAGIKKDEVSKVEYKDRKSFNPTKVPQATTGRTHTSPLTTEDPKKKAETAQETAGGKISPDPDPSPAPTPAAAASTAAPAPAEAEHKTDDAKRSYIQEVAIQLAKDANKPLEEAIYSLSSFKSNKAGEEGKIIGTRDLSRLSGRWLNSTYGAAKEVAQSRPAEAEDGPFKPAFTVTYEDEGHLYAIDGRQVPSITQVTALLHDFTRMDPGLLARAATRGTLLHKACELEALGVLDPDTVDDWIVDDVAAFFAWRSQSGFRVMFSEEIVGSKRFGFAGRLDLFGTIGRQHVLVDIKSGASLPGYAVQPQPRRSGFGSTPWPPAA